ncbi:MAG: ABC transporter permease [Gammaproteobacteria bacterium]
MKLTRSKSVFITSSILIVWCILALFGNLFDLSPNDINLEKILVSLNFEQWLGYDDLGRSISDRLIIGAKTSLFVSLGVVSLSALLGTTIGMLAAWQGGWLDLIIVRIIDIFLAFPGILLAIALAGILGPGINNIIIALTVVGWVGFARLARAQTLSIKNREHIQAAKALGTPAHTTLRKHILPLIMAPVIVEATFGIASVIIAEAGLSFLGLGIQPPTASWGTMIRDGTRYMLVAPHMVIAPGVTLCLVVLSVNMLGDKLRDWMDIKAS